MGELLEKVFPVFAKKKIRMAIWGTLGDDEVNHNYQASECYRFHITGIRPKRVKKIMTNGVPARW